MALRNLMSFGGLRFRAGSAGKRSGGRRTGAPFRSERRPLRTDVESRRALDIEWLEERVVLSATTVAAVPIYLPQQYSLFNYAGYLTEPSGQAPITIAENFLRSHASELGMVPSNMDHYRVTTNYVTQSTGATTLTFQQSLNGIGVENANFNMTVTADGRLLNVAGGFLSGLSQGASGGGRPALNALQVLTTAAGALGVALNEHPSVLETGADGPTRFRATSVSLHDITAKLHYVATGPQEVHLAWNLTVQAANNGHWYRIDVDSTSGGLVSLVDIGDYADYEVFAIPGRDPNDGPRTIQTNPQIINPSPATVPSPFGWHDTNGVAGAELTITSGNNVNAYADRNFDFLPDAGSQPDGGAALDFTGALVPINVAQPPSTYQAAAVTNLFYWVNVLHDIHYLYGFDEAARNFQVNNYGRGGIGGDAVQAGAQAGAAIGAVDNAFFVPLPDGQQSFIAMFEWDVTNPRLDGDLDAEIIIHEFGHGVSNRITGDTLGLSALQSGGLGEGWSDWWALMLTQKTASETTDGRGVGTYVLGQPNSGPGIRDFRYDYDITDPSLETFLNYGIGPGQSVEAHDAGTRWAAALWDINHLFIQKYGFEPNVYNSTSGAGNIRALHLIMNALKIQPLDPSFLNARDAILLADELLYGGADQFEIWSAFARRGLGATASTLNADSFLLTTSFSIPPGLAPVISMGGDVAKLEGDTATTNIVFSLSIAGDLHLQTITVPYMTADGTAVAPVDYLAQSGIVTFLPDGPRTQTITVQIIGDTDIEPNETFFVRLGTPIGAIVARSQAIGTILNDDVDLSINDISLIEGNAGTSNAVFTVSTIGTINQVIRVNYATADDTATAPIDYLQRSGTLTFSPGATVGRITVPVVGDTFNEATETFFVQLSNPQGARLAKGTGVGTIIDNDPLPALYVNDVHVTTTQAGTLAAMFTVALDNRSGRDVSVHYVTIDDTAKAGVDYVAQEDDLTFAPGISTMQVIVPVMGNAVYLPNQRFFLDLSNASNAKLADARGIGTIIFAEPPPDQYIIDDGDAGFSATGGWTNQTNLLAYQLDFDYHAAGNGSGAATWTFDGIPSGTYQVFTRWIPFTNRATNAPYTILDGAASLGTVTVNQQLAPVGDQSNGIIWQSLGSFYSSSGTLRVRLNDNANGYVIADAVRIVSGGIGAQVPEIDVAGFEHSIADGDMSPAFDDGTEFGAVATASHSQTHTFVIANTGNAALHLTGNPRVLVSGAAAQDFTVIQQPDFTVAAGGSTSFQLLFHPTAEGLRQATVSIASDDASEPSYSFAVQGTGDTPGPSQFTIDDAGGGFHQAGNWVTSSNTLAYLGGMRSSAPGTGSDKAFWSFAGLAPGTYEVYATWIPFGNRATNAPYTVSNGKGTSYTRSVNQQQSSGGGVGASLGTIDVTAGFLTVSLTDNANGYVVADSVTIIRQGAAPIALPFAPIAQNVAMPMDVNADSRISALDALIVINALNSASAAASAAPGAAPLALSAATPAAGSAAAFFFTDVNGDGQTSPLDALLVINYLNHPPAAASAASGSGGPSVSASVVVSSPSQVPAVMAAVAVDRAMGQISQSSSIADAADTVTAASGTSVAVPAATTAPLTPVAVQAVFGTTADEDPDEGEFDPALVGFSA